MCLVLEKMLDSGRDIRGFIVKIKQNPGKIYRIEQVDSVGKPATPTGLLAIRVSDLQAQGKYLRMPLNNFEVFWLQFNDLFYNVDMTNVLEFTHVYVDETDTLLFALEEFMGGYNRTFPYQEGQVKEQGEFHNSQSWKE